jgi:hypothetical protein
MDLDVLIIEEISMVSGEYFDTLEKTVREIRRPFGVELGDMPAWGGIQVILVGVFY